MSASAADALKFLSKRLYLDKFQNIDATVKFIRNIDHFLDLLNSRNLYAKSTKTVMKEDNYLEWKPFLQETIFYLQNLKTHQGKFLYKTRKRTPILGFIKSTCSLLDIYKEYVVTGENVKYLMTYKFSQDHLELFFSSVRYVSTKTIYKTYICFHF